MTTETDDEPVHEDAMVDALARTAFVTMAALTEVGARHDLSVTQLRVLGVLRNRRVRMTALAAHLGLEKSSMTGLVERAERRGLVARAPNPEDGRAVDAYLTASGADLARTVSTEAQRELATFTSALTASQQARLTDLLGRLLVRP